MRTYDSIVYTKTDIENGRKFKNGDTTNYMCTFCGSSIGLDGSVSSRGYNLVCMVCFRKLERITNIKNLVGVIQRVGERQEAMEECELINNEPIIDEQTEMECEA